jgi:hypothetical protein
MSALLDEGYLDWLYGQVSSLKSRARTRTYWSLAKQLYDTEFVWLISNDDNRVEDGRDLRVEFAQTRGIDIDPECRDLPCNMLELLIVLARALSFEVDGSTDVWFWHLIRELELDRFNDKEYDDNARDLIHETLERVIWRRYSPNGHGGLFPLRNAHEDQREVELWYQLNAYLLEQF